MITLTLRMSLMFVKGLPSTRIISAALFFSMSHIDLEETEIICQHVENDKDPLR
jgi:hypothetical protein